ncbi:hypothetical protein GOP47_0012826 [Adiantum capillus-veneris]|uniref:Uncharacterized protein n=1 Tax=Adiantum capillus-veneris TaxID=13818 RepID=A0A9D4URE9_ADICA|nr:hypothetical protein GOP47_0012826 [Adiantum capillus-veneris]
MHVAIGTLNVRFENIWVSPTTIKSEEVLRLGQSGAGASLRTPGSPLQTRKRMGVLATSQYCMRMFTYIQLHPNNKTHEHLVP